MGGMVLCAKPEEVPLWLLYTKQHGRRRQVVVVDETQSINVCDYLLARGGARAIPTLIECLLRIISDADVATGNVGTPGEAFWLDSAREVMQHTLPLQLCAYGTVSIASLIDFVVSAATKPEQYVDEQWAPNSFAAQTLRRAVDHPSVPLPESELKPLISYWFRNWPSLPDRLRGSIQATVTTRLGRFRHGLLRDLFCRGTTFVPEMAFGGGILILALPALTYLDEGLISQRLIKCLFHIAVGARNGLHPRYRERLTFIFADESQYFISESDEPFLSTCRGSRCCVVYLTQNISGWHARLGPGKADAVEALISKFGTIVFHGNPCNKTNTYAANLIGRGIQLRANTNVSTGHSFSRGLNDGTSNNRGASSSSGSGGGGFNSSSGTNSGSGENYGANVGNSRNENSSYGVAENMDFIIEPRFFATGLRSGGPQNNYRVDGVLVKAGGNFADGYMGCPNVLLTTFLQRGKR